MLYENQTKKTRSGDNIAFYAVTPIKEGTIIILKYEITEVYVLKTAYYMSSVDTLRPSWLNGIINAINQSFVLALTDIEVGEKLLYGTVSS